MGNLYNPLQLKILNALQQKKSIADLADAVKVKNRSTLYSALQGLPVQHAKGYWTADSERIDILMELLEDIIDNLYDGDIIQASEELRERL